MDDHEFRKTMRALNAVPCIFEKTILGRQARCECSVRHNIAEREVAGCRDEAAQLNCCAWLSVLRDEAGFALGITPKGTLAHAKMLKMQVGGLRGVRAVLDPEQAEEATIDNIHGLIKAAQDEFGNLHELPFQTVIRHIQQFKGRQRSKKRRKD